MPDEDRIISKLDIIRAWDAHETRNPALREGRRGRASGRPHLAQIEGADDPVDDANLVLREGEFLLAGAILP